MQRTGDRRWHVCLGYAAAGILCIVLPTLNGLGFIPGFVGFCAVVTFTLCPNGVLLALASAQARGPAMPVSLALFNSVGNISGFFGSILLGFVADATCSYDAAFYVMGIALLLGSLLVLTTKDGVAGADPDEVREVELPTTRSRATSSTRQPDDSWRQPSVEPLFEVDEL